MGGGGGGRRIIRAMPPNKNYRGLHIFDPQAKVGSMGPFGRQAEARDVPREPVSGFRRTDQEPSPAGTDQGPAGTNQGPTERIRDCGTDQGPAEQTRTPQDRLGLR